MRIAIPIFLFCVVLLVQPVAGQPSPSPTPASAEKTFVSIDGGFRIDLPSRISGASPIRPVAGESTGGSLLVWRFPDGRHYQVAFIDRILTGNAKDTLLDRLGDDLVAEMSRIGQTLLDRSTFKFKQYDAVDLRFTVDGGTAQTRYILVGNRLFILTTGWPLGALSDSYLRPFQSFDLIDRKATIARRIEQATPAELPQSPRVKLASTDARMDSFKGKVKVVHTLKKYLGTSANSELRKTSERHFDSAGNLVKEISFDYRGSPSNVVVYGFIDGKRVATWGSYIDYEYNPPPMAPPPPPARLGSSVPTPVPVPSPPRKPADTRFSSSYEFKFDDKKRLIERVTRNNREEISWRSTFKYDGETIQELNYARDGKITKRAVSRVDERGNPVEETYFSTDESYPENSVYTYEYLKFDSKDNWTERAVLAKTAKYKGGTNEARFVEYREISYH